MSGKIAFDVDVLANQAQKVDQLAVDVSSAASSLGSAALGGRAFGTLGGFLAASVQSASSAASTACVDVQGALEGTADQLRAVASDVREVEQDIVQTMRELEREIGYAGSR